MKRLSSWLTVKPGSMLVVFALVAIAAHVEEAFFLDFKDCVVFIMLILQIVPFDWSTKCDITKAQRQRSRL